MLTAAKAGATGMVAAAAAIAAVAQVTRVQPSGFGDRVEVIARSVYVDILDDSKHAVGKIPAGVLTVSEDGVSRPVLEVRLRSGDRTRPMAQTEANDTAAPGVLATPAPRFVLVALDPVTLGRQAWKAVIAQLDATADALVGIGPVDVLALTTPPLRAVTGATDAAAVRAALAHVAATITPQDRFYRNRSRAIVELQQVLRQRSPLLEAERLLQQLAPEEERVLRDCLDRLDAALAGSGRPLVAFWAAQGDPDTAGFVRSRLPADLDPAAALPFTASPGGAVTVRWRGGERGECPEPNSRAGFSARGACGRVGFAVSLSRRFDRKRGGPGDRRKTVPGPDRPTA